MRYLRPALGLSLALLLALTSLSLAAARGQPTPAGEIVICTGMGLQTVTVDAEGNPVGPSHICPDGVAAIVALALTAPALPERRVEAGRVPAPFGELTRAGVVAPAARSRGPPAMTA